MISPYQNFIIIDVETGGLLSKGKRAVYDVAITEIALAIVNKDLEIVDKMVWMIKPYKEDLIYDKEAEIASGISRIMCEKQGIELIEVVNNMLTIFKKYKSGSSLPVLIGHNFIKFDSDFVLNMFEFCKLDLLKYVNPEPEDTLKWSRLCWTESTNYKLGTCCENAGITLKDAHRALTDTVATAMLWIYFMKNLRGVSVTNQAEEPVRYRDTFEL